MDQSTATANPAPLGLFGFALSTILLNLHNAGFYELNSMILSMGLFYGGLAQIVAGIMEAKKNNIFGLTAFVSYGCFWLSLVGLILLPKTGWTVPATNEAMTAYLVLWGIFTVLLFIGTFRVSVALQFVFGSLSILFFLLALGYLTGNMAVKKFAGYEGILCGSIALYTAIATLLNEMLNRVVLPVGLVISSKS